MRQKFCLFVQRHHSGSYTVTVPGIQEIPPADRFSDSQPVSPGLSSFGVVLEEVKDNVVEALARRLAKADPGSLHRYVNHKDGQRLEKVEVELRPPDRHGQRRRDKIRLKFSLLVTREESEQYLVSVPRLTSPPLSFYCFKLDELATVAGLELATYFKETSLEDLLEYQYQRQEFLEEVEVSFTPLTPQKERKPKSEQEDEWFFALKSSGVNLTARVRENKVGHAYHRDHAVNECLSVLAADRSNSILLVGPPGTGKTAIVHEVVRRMTGDTAPPALKKRQVWYTNANHLIAGCSHIGEWQGKLENIINEIKKRRHILFIDDVVGLTEAGRHSKGDENMADFLKPYLSDSTIVLMGECTRERYAVCENRDPGFLSLFRTLMIEETNEEETLRILGPVTAALEREFKIRIQPAAAEAAIEMTRRFQPYRAFPGKAITLMEQVASEASKAPEDQRAPVTRQFTVSAFARHTGLPEFILSDHLTLEPAAVERHFSERLIGQPAALRSVVDLVTVIKAGLNDPQKPLGVFFFVGPTGVGKTEMAKALAQYLFGASDRMIRFDMSEFADPLAAGRLIGTAYGEQEGELTRRIRLQPFSVLLLDEFEKAHSTIYDVMLQVLGEGRLTDAAGRTSDFRSAIIIMTSNLGASPQDQRRVGLRDEISIAAAESYFRGQVERYFRPEFVNRLDQVVVFQPLDRAAMRQIASRELGKLLEREGVSRRSLMVEIDDEVMDLLLQTGFSPTYGARPLKREIERRIITPMAHCLVANRLTGAQLVRIGCEAGEIRLSATSLVAARQRVEHQAAPLGTGGAVQRLDLSALIEELAATRLNLHRWKAGDTAREIDREWRGLLAQTRRKDFVHHGAEAHRTWARIYHLERILKRIGQLTDRAEYLEEFALLCRRQRDSRSLRELAESYTELARDSAYLEIELLCAHLKEGGQAVVTLELMGRKADRQSQQSWLRTMAEMYLRWGKRKGYDFSVFVPTDPFRHWAEDRGFAVQAHIPTFNAGPPVRPAWAEVKVSDFGKLLARLEELDLSSLALSFKGVNVFGFLKGEAGIHKLLTRSEDEPGAPFQTVQAAVSPLDEDALCFEYLNPPPGEPRATGGENTGDSPPPTPAKIEKSQTIIRLYQPEGIRHVRDLRTEVQTTQVKEVFEGHIDEFILAYLKTTEASQAWEDPH